MIKPVPCLCLKELKKSDAAGPGTNIDTTFWERQFLRDSAMFSVSFLIHTSRNPWVQYGLRRGKQSIDDSVQLNSVYTHILILYMWAMMKKSLSPRAPRIKVAPGPSNNHWDCAGMRYPLPVLHVYKNIIYVSTRISVNVHVIPKTHKNRTIYIWCHYHAKGPPEREYPRRPHHHVPIYTRIYSTSLCRCHTPLWPLSFRTCVHCLWMSQWRTTST